MAAETITTPGAPMRRHLFSAAATTSVVAAAGTPVPAPTSGDITSEPAFTPTP
jgi:hypothetical protein